MNATPGSALALALAAVLVVVSLLMLRRARLRVEDALDLLARCQLAMAQSAIDRNEANEIMARALKCQTEGLGYYNDAKALLDKMDMGEMK